jgi:hypothetical protein
VRADGALKAGEKWHYRSSDAGTPLREIPADRMKDAREVGLVPGLRFLVHRDLGEGKTWSVTERTTGNTLTTGHTTRELAEFAAQQRVQQVGADRVRSVVREFLQKTGGLTEGEALAGTAEPRKGKLPGLDEVIAAYKRATGGELDANMNATAIHLHRALVDQNVKTVRDLAHPDNPASRRVIEVLGLGGRKLPRGARESAKIAEDWLRSVGFDLFLTDTDGNTIVRVDPPSGRMLLVVRLSKYRSVHHAIVEACRAAMPAVAGSAPTPRAVLTHPTLHPVKP